MTNYAVFLRGINVGGINIKMAQLRYTLSHLPVRDVGTLLASGNVVCASELSAAQLKTRVEAALREAFGYDAWVVVMAERQLAARLAACPFPADDSTHHSYVTLSSEPAMIAELAELGSAFDAASVTVLGPDAVAWLAPAGGTLDSPFSKLTAKARYKSSTTTRNVRTLLKCRDALAALAD